MSLGLYRLTHFIPFVKDLAVLLGINRNKQENETKIGRVLMVVLCCQKCLVWNLQIHIYN